MSETTFIHKHLFRILHIEDYHERWYVWLYNDNERPRLRLSDDQVWQEIIKIAGVTCSSDFQK